MNERVTGTVCALTAAALFGTAIPLSKHLLSEWPGQALAGMLYLSSGVGLLGVQAAVRTGEPLRRSDLPWLFGAVLFGGVLAPVALMYGLAWTTGHAAALLSNVETLFTAVIAVLIFRERLSHGEWVILLLIVLGACAVGWGSAQEHQGGRPVTGAVFVVLACFFWGIDNNVTQKISRRDPVQIACVKGLAAGVTNLGLAFLMGSIPPGDARNLLYAALVGLFSYGVSLVFFVLSLRRLGAARTGAFFATAPVYGVGISWLALGEVPRREVLAGGAVMLFGVLGLSWLQAREKR